MSAIKLFILGFLMEDSMSPYDLAKLIGDNDVSEMIKISKPAVYKNFIKLEDEGYLTSVRVKEGEMPEKTIYSITDKGRAGFGSLMEKYARDEIRFHFDFNSMLINLGKISYDQSLKLLGELEGKLLAKQERLAWYMRKYHFLPLEARMIMKQHAMLNDTLIKWLEEYREKYKSEYGKV